MSVADWMALFPCDVASREVVVDWLYQKFLDNLFWHAPCQRCSLRRSQLSWWTPECFATCVARNGVITCVSTILRPSLDSGLLGPHSIAQCARPSGPSCRTGKTVLPGSPARTLVLPLPPFGALFAALLLHEVTLLCKSGFLQTQTVLFRNTRSWTVGGHTSPASVHVVPRLMMRFSSPSRPGLMRLFPLPSFLHYLMPLFLI